MRTWPLLAALVPSTLSGCGGESDVRSAVLVTLDTTRADALVAAVREAGGDVEYHVYDGEGHGFRRLENVVDDLDRASSFLQRRLAVGGRADG